jgi:hypothetical protein
VIADLIGGAQGVAKGLIESHVASCDGGMRDAKYCKPVRTVNEVVKRRRHRRTRKILPKAVAYEDLSFKETSDMLLNNVELKRI